ncbi:MAG TPA: VOC family protein [Chitinophagales bacterium]|nr:VOC family protein [Chitinophagales bacterium]
MLKFSYTILYVKDVKISIDFYEEAFGFKRKFISPDNTYAELTTGETTLSFAAITLAKSNLKNGFSQSKPGKKPFGIEIGFTTDNVAAAVERADGAGAVVIETPKTKPWGQVVAYVRDLDGFLIEICTPMS